LGDSGGDGITPLERLGTKECHVLRSIAAVALVSAASLAAAATTTTSSTALNSTAPWWERVTITIAGDGQARSCRFESSVGPGAAKDCQVEASAAAAEKTATGEKDRYTRITFERRYTPDWQPKASEAPTGEMLLGRQVMSLAIGAKGTVEGCQIVSASGDMKPEYGCREASAERFQASASTGAARHQGYMTVIVYGHSEHLV
jgi:hypothetical protein